MAQTNYQKGLYAETLASILLKVKGYRVLEKRYKTSYGEIDLIVTRGNLLAFVEVKARPCAGTALEAILPKAQGRIANAAQHFISHHPEFIDHDMRFDVVSIAPKSFPVHHTNMWRI